MRGGDVIVSVGAESMDKLSPEEVAGRVRGPPGSKVKLGLLREGEEMTIIIERAEVKKKKAFSSPFLNVAPPHLPYVRNQIRKTRKNVFFSLCPNVAPPHLPHVRN